MEDVHRQLLEWLSAFSCDPRLLGLARFVCQALLAGVTDQFDILCHPMPKIITASKGNAAIRALVRAVDDLEDPVPGFLSYILVM